MKVDLSFKNILLTGASRGIGAALARSLGKSGARIAVHYNNNKDAALEVEREVGNESFIVQANLKNPNEVVALFEQVQLKMTKIDVLINNAGIAINSDIDKKDAEWLNDLQETISVNLIASALLCKKAVTAFAAKLWYYRCIGRLLLGRVPLDGLRDYYASASELV